MQEYDATVLVEKINHLSTTILIDQVNYFLAIVKVMIFFTYNGLV